jgi:nitrate reductase gamma subunit
MAVLTAIYTAGFYAATVWLVYGLARKIVQYWRTPAPLKIPTMPAPLTTGGVAMRLVREVVLFESLFKANKWIWLFGWMFHAALLLAMLRHLRYFTEPVWTWVVLVQPFGTYAGFAMLAGLGLMLVLLLAITASGLAMRYLARTDIVALKKFILGLMLFDWQPMPADPVLMVHLGLVIALMAVFPFSKLLHAPGLFFSPTRNQVDSAREKRHLAPWAAKLEAGGE